MSTKPLTLEERRFIDQMSAVLVPWTVPAAAGRIYAYLMLCEEPMSLDEIGAALELSKANASVMTRLLEKHGMAVRHSVPGTKRVLYGTPHNFAALVMEKARLMDALGTLMQQGAAATSSDTVRQRLQNMADFHLSMRDVIEAAVRRLDASVPGLAGNAMESGKEVPAGK